MKGIRPCAEFDPSSFGSYLWKNLPFLTSFTILFYTTIAEAIYLFVTLREYFSFIEITSQIPCIGFCSIGLYKMLITSMRRNTMAEMVQQLREMWPAVVSAFSSLSLFLHQFLKMLSFIPSRRKPLNRRLLSRITC